jgi:predicted RNA-binding protein with PUA-like domain
MKPGDRVFYYHTGKEKAIVGEMVVASEPVLDQAAVAVEMKPVRKLAKPVTLTAIRAEKVLGDWDLVRMSRLSVVPVTKAQWTRVVKMSEKSD